ncbi:class III lanthionine synthetase LanKC N-terminal domain-containing protein [Actinomadura montaniterrae]
MDNTGSPDWLERIVRQHVGTGHSVIAGPVWLAVRPDGAVLPKHGWKKHVSSSAADFAELLVWLMPLLAAEGCAFKLARSRRVLHELNDGHTSPAIVGKAVTVHPERRVRDLGLRLAAELRGHRGRESSAIGGFRRRPGLLPVRVLRAPARPHRTRVHGRPRP